MAVGAVELVGETWERVGKIDKVGREGLSEDLTFSLRTE